MFRFLLRSFAITLLLAGLFTGAAFAQQITGDIVGTVKDASGAVVPNASVTVTNTGTGEVRKVQSTGNGEYAVSLLPVGHYSVTVVAAGFKQFQVADLELAAGVPRRIDANLELGAVSEVVEVQATSPLLQTDSSQVSSLISQETVQDVPLNGRNITNLITNQAGVNQGMPVGIQNGQRPDDRRQTSSVSANGQEPYFNSRYIDGVDNNERFYGLNGISPSVDAIQQINVDTNNYPAEEGRAAGAVISILTNSGTNQFHGSAYEFFRNDIFDAKDYFSQPGMRKPELRQNQFGGSIGGPIFKDKTFFFFDIEMLRRVQGQNTVQQEVPSANDHALVDALPAWQGTAVFDLYPLPNVNGANAADCGDAGGSQPTCLYASSPNLVQNITTLDARIDHHLGQNDTLFARYSYNPVTTSLGCFFPLTQGFCPGGAQFIANGAFPGTNDTTVQGGQLNYQHIFTPKLLMELRTGFLRINIDSQPINQGTNASSKLGIAGANTPDDPRATGLTGFHFLDGHADLGDQIAYPILNIQNAFQWNGDVVYNTGAHSFKFGAALIRRQVNYLQEFEPTGWLFFLSPIDMAEHVPAVVLFRQNQYQFEYLRTWEPTVFAQDNWRIKPNFTVNLGVRYDVFTPFTEAKNRISNFDINTLAFNLGGTGGVKTDYGDIAPRFGFSWQPQTGTVLRGGYGISYYPGDFAASVQLPNPPYQNPLSCSPIAGTCGTSNGQPLGLLDTSLPLSPAYVDPSIIYTTNASGLGLTAKQTNWRSAYVQQWNLTGQQEIGNSTLTIAYVGEVGRRQQMSGPQDANLPAPDSNGTYTLVNGAVPHLYAAQLPAVGNIGLSANERTSNYNSLQASYARRFTRGLSFNLNYTWAHALDTWSGFNDNGALGQWPGNASYDYGNSEIDVRNRIAGQLVWQLPWAKDYEGVKGIVAKGWSLSSNAFWQTGMPFTVVDSAKPGGAFGDFNASIRTNVVPNTNPYAQNRGPQQWLNPAAFSPAYTGSATTFTLGNERSNQYFGPYLRQLDMSVFKNQTLHDNWVLQFRAECFNVTNTENFTQPVNTYGAATFGQILGTAPNFYARQFQFALRLKF